MRRRALSALASLVLAGWVIRLATARRDARLATVTHINSLKGESNDRNN